LQQLVNFRGRTDLCLNLLESLRRIKLRPRKQAKRLVERFDALSREAAPFEPQLIFSVHLDFTLPGGGRKRQDVLSDYALAADHRVPAYAAEMVNCAARADYRPVLNCDVPSNSSCVRQHAVAANLNIVGDMQLHHQQVFIADGGDHAPALSSAVDGHEFANFVAVSDAGAGALAAIFQILGRESDARIRKEYIVFARLKRSFDHYMRHDARSCTDVNMRTNDRIRPDFG